MATRESRHFRRNERAYILNDEFLPVNLGEGLGDLDHDDAFELSVIKRNALGLPVTPEIISLFAPPPEKPKRASHTSRASKNNPYICVHCAYKTTRYGNMIKHLENSHGDFSTDPRDNHY